MSGSDRHRIGSVAFNIALDMLETLERRDVQIYARTFGVIPKSSWKLAKPIVRARGAKNSRPSKGHILSIFLFFQREKNENQKNAKRAKVRATLSGFYL